MTVSTLCVSKSQIAALGNLPKAAPVDRNASSPTIKERDMEELFNGI